MRIYFLTFLLISCQTKKALNFKWTPTRLRYSGPSQPSTLLLGNGVLLKFSAGSELLWRGKSKFFIKSIDQRNAVVVTEKIQKVDIKTGERSLIVDGIVWHSKRLGSKMLISVRSFKGQEEKKKYYSAPKSLIEIDYKNDSPASQLTVIDSHECLPDLGELEIQGEITTPCPLHIKRLLQKYGD